MPRNNTNDRCAKSWQTPFFSCHASTAELCTPVEPGWYLSCTHTHCEAANTASDGELPFFSSRAFASSSRLRGV